MNSYGEPDSDPPRGGNSRVTTKHVAIPMGNSAEMSDNQINAASERWYLKIDDKEYGPVTRPQMEYFLRPPRLCSQLRVMCTTQEGVWHSITRRETLDKVLFRFGIVAEPTTVTVGRPPAPRGPSWTAKFIDGCRDRAEDALSWVAGYRVLLAVVFLFVAVNGGLLVLMRNRDREILNRYESIWKSVQHFQAEDGQNGEWRRFAEQARVETETLQKELARTSKAGPPVRRQLLTIGRDCLLKILKSETPIATGSDQTKYFEQQLRILNDQIPIN